MLQRSNLGTRLFLAEQRNTNGPGAVPATPASGSCGSLSAVGVCTAWCSARRRGGWLGSGDWLSESADATSQVLGAIARVARRNTIVWSEKAPDGTELLKLETNNSWCLAISLRFPSKK